jgi:hypothetical protein
VQWITTMFFWKWNYFGSRFFITPSNEKPKP